MQSSQPASHKRPRRAPMACKNCRSRKIRCIQTTDQVDLRTKTPLQPCQRCLKRNLPCEYAPIGAESESYASGTPPISNSPESSAGSTSHLEPSITYWDHTTGTNSRAFADAQRIARRQSSILHSRRESVSSDASTAGDPLYSAEHLSSYHPMSSPFLPLYEQPSHSHSGSYDATTDLPPMDLSTWSFSDPPMSTRYEARRQYASRDPPAVGYASHGIKKEDTS
ncbi:hypothetical protein CYLTODRAFT_417796 [Cylindrobasidium torrendii FP15055 ss-10]|uniref:Zn(2)-C6 fungal-type domain-containing protein n=1 Tax=Cylindrobasidium torrendii FP15055 ss-10 TaxID=1314674 RepID=A0A0D7BSK8_9AGAR|nr:hypothetical protein CYLTODRAFT_417796 [Cylindrobasidium torrendii FP15055 ss-10]